MQSSFKANVKQQLLLAAKDYSELFDKIILVSSSEFQFEKEYVLRFSKTNFLHLTGVISHLSAEEFFLKCFNETIEEDDFDYDKVKNKTNIKNKLKCLVSISTMFNKEVLVQEIFVKNRVVCKLATADDRCTIGFADGHYCLWPKTLLNKNHLDESKPIFLVKPIVKKKD